MYIHITQHVIPQKCTLSTSAVPENAFFPVHFSVKLRSVISIILLIPFKRIVIYHYLPFAAACVRAFIDVWNRIAEENNWKIDYTVADFSGLFGMLDTGKIDTVARQTSSNNETRREKYLFSDVYLYSTYNLVTRADSTLETLDDFKNTKIGVVMGGDGELNLKKLNEEHNLGIEIVSWDALTAG